MVSNFKPRETIGVSVGLLDIKGEAARKLPSATITLLLPGRSQVLFGLDYPDLR